ncbi:hypothetical protein JTB14_037006 [Gonioctena quinquepunctata]|nr:hypothetical protein JTB14_037006 [Gonioctena quinquepunctata]
MTAFCRTVSADALCVIAGVPPIDFLAQEKSRQRSTNNRKSKEAEDNVNVPRELGRHQSHCLVDEETDSEHWDKACKHEYTDFYLTQFLSAHGSSRTLTHRIKRSPECLCIYCNGEDDVDQTIRYCDI